VRQGNTGDEASGREALFRGVQVSGMEGAAQGCGVAEAGRGVGEVYGESFTRGGGLMFCVNHNREWVNLPNVRASHCPECLAEERDAALARAEAAEAENARLKAALKAIAMHDIDPESCYHSMPGHCFGWCQEKARDVLQESEAGR
jgi:hypothetical protein